MTKIQEIVQVFFAEISRWIKARLTGSVTLTINLNQGGCTGWHIQTMQTTSKGKVQ